MIDLWQRNTSENFWMCQICRSPEAWQAAAAQALPLLELPGSPSLADIPAFTLGEGRFGSDHWQLSLSRRLYNLVKPAIPRFITRLLRRFVTATPLDNEGWSHWPVDDRYARFLRETLRQLMLEEGISSLQYRAFWPEGKPFALVLTHDIETAQGQSFVREIAAREESQGFRSCFNFVLERYDLDVRLMDELRERGFDMGCHGLKHDGCLFSSRQEFERRAVRINAGAKRHAMRGFRSPLTHRQPEWMQSLEIEYDSSFFDTDLVSFGRNTHVHSPALLRLSTFGFGLLRGFFK